MKVPLIALNAMNWRWDPLLRTISTWGRGIESTWHGEYFSSFWNFTVGYFIVDLLWVCIIPRCVKSPTTIIQHHIASLLYLLVPIFWPGEYSTTSGTNNHSCMCHGSPFPRIILSRIPMLHGNMYECRGEYMVLDRSTGLQQAGFRAVDD
jgi:hypothetical protein